MTLLISWIAVDTHAPTSAYLVGDSRFSWGNNKFFDYGKKVFSSNLYPEIFGYSGDVLFPSTVLSQIIEMIDANILFSFEMTCDQKNKLVMEKLSHSFSKYPLELCANNIQILHISRDTIVKSYPDFYCYLMQWNVKTGWSLSKKDIPNFSDLLFVLGSGRNEFLDNYARYKSGPNSNTSRNVFHCFIDTLFNARDIYCGGPPQLVGIYRKPNSQAMNFGIIYNKKRYFLGTEVPEASYFSKIEWRNEFFEICEGKQKRISAKAAKQPDLLRRK